MGRPVSPPSLEELWAKADLVAVIRPLSSTNVSDQLSSNYGSRNPSDYRAMNTRCEVVLAMKTSEKMQDWHAHELTLLHFRHAPSGLEFDGGLFMYFDFAPAQLQLIVKGDAAHPIAMETKPVYLAFLKRDSDGRFRPVSGDYDSELSFRVLAIPFGGAVRYAIEDGTRAKEAKPGS